MTAAQRERSGDDAARALARSLWVGPGPMRGQVRTRRMATRARSAWRALCACLVAAALLPACATSRPAAPVPSASADRIARTLPASGPLAFHPHRDELIWADGRDGYRLDLRSGQRQGFHADGAIVDLAYAADGAVWLAAGHAERWQGDRRACRGDADGITRVFGAEGDGGARVAGYRHSDGIGPLRHQYWLDPRCRALREEIAPLPPGVSDPTLDSGAAPATAAATVADWRAGPRPAADGTLAVSHDRRWRVIVRNGERRLEGAPAVP